MDWLTASEALALLGTQKQTLYANVSRGRIKAKPDPRDSRKSLYRSDDVQRMAGQRAGRRTQAAVATQAMAWGEPVLRTSLSTIVDGRLLYRGQDVLGLAETATLEDVAALLWRAPASLSETDALPERPGIKSAFMALAQRAGESGGMAQTSAEAGRVLGTLAQALTGESGGLLDERLARRWGRPGAADSIRRALVLLADHELNASTFAARVTVSTGASLWAGALSGLATLTGPRHGLASRAIAALAEDVGHADDPEEALRDWLGEGRHVPGLGHRLYPEGDPRCAALLVSFELPPAFTAYAAAAKAITGDEPNVDFALAALVARFALPGDAALELFAMARCVGWLAHMLEQSMGGDLIRPRARYAAAG